MTTGVKENRAAVQFPLPVGSTHAGVAYLVIERCANGIRIRQSVKNGRKLNRFWMVWMREVLQKAPAKYQLKIELFEKNVRISSPVPLNDWLWVAYNLAATVIPLYVPITRTKRQESNRSVLWLVDRNVDFFAIDLRLPDAITKHFRINGSPLWVQLTVSGTGKKRRIIGLGEAALLIELAVAQACQDECPAITQLLIQEAPYVIPGITLSQCT